ncbi:hypothetical protein LTR86_010829 [Recurvomyces mirabilis]|nr:hypothetical protein LTR86_010829 [Recurvomyces mirabilis]
MRSFQSSSTAYANCRRPAKTPKTGFLDLPDEVRHRIYELAIYDHDRGVVFLPRALPRKVTPQTDLNVRYALDGNQTVPYLETRLAVLVEPTVDDGTLATGIWSTSGVVEDELESTSSVSSDGESGDGDSSDSGYVKTELALGLPWEEERGGIPCADCLILSLENDTSPEGCESECGCDCHELGNGSDKLESDNTEDGEDPEDGIHVQPPPACLAGACNDEHCEHCAGFGLGASQNELAYVDESDVDEEWQRQDRDEEDDLEHFDAEEQVGMLYEFSEPSILFACTEIRSECLPVYYSANTFSWRFDWQDYTRSLARFMEWVDVTVGDYAQLTPALSLEGRHIVEEGVGFSANASFASSTSRSKVGIEFDDFPDTVLAGIADGLASTMELALALPFAGKSCSSSSTVRLQKLGTIFVQAVQCVSNDNLPLLTATEPDVSAETTAEQKLLTPAKGLPRQMTSRMDKETFPDEEDEVEVLFARAVRAVSEEL